jgi:hypothetical protein
VTQFDEGKCTCLYEQSVVVTSVCVASAKLEKKGANDITMSVWALGGCDTAKFIDNWGPWHSIFTHFAQPAAVRPPDS